MERTGANTVTVLTFSSRVGAANSLGMLLRLSVSTPLSEAAFCTFATREPSVAAVLIDAFRVASCVL